MQSTQTILLDDVAEKIIPNSVIKKKNATKHKRKTHYFDDHTSLDNRLPSNNLRWTTGSSYTQCDAIDLDSPTLDSLADGDTLDGLRISLEDYWSKVYDKTERFYEWNNGILEEKPRMAQLRKFLICKWFLHLLYDYLYVNPIATVIQSDMGFGFPRSSGGTQVRGPDIGIVLHTNPVQLGEWDYSYQGIFDLCIELVSDSRREHITRDTQEKRTEYAHAGVTEYFILDDSRPPRPNETAFYRLHPSGIYQPIQPLNGIITCSVLPDFQFRRQHLLTQPDLGTLLDDPVYQGYILPHARAERLETERERQRADEEQRRADEEQRRADEEQRRADEEQRRADEEQRRADELTQALAAERVYKEQLHTYLTSLGIDLPENLQ